MMVFSYITTIVFAFIFSHIIEWLAHKYILHGFGKTKNNFWSFHWHNHHKKARKHNFYDEDYLNGWSGPPLKEKAGLLLLVLLHSPLAFFAPVFFITLVYCAIRYYRIHRYAHLHPCWARYYLRCHYDHHMGKNQDANWGVTTEWVDKLLKTRINYYN